MDKDNPYELTQVDVEYVNQMMRPTVKDSSPFTIEEITEAMTLADPTNSGTIQNSVLIQKLSEVFRSRMSVV